MASEEFSDEEYFELVREDEVESLPTITMKCNNPACGLNMDDDGNFVGGGTYEAPAVYETEGAAPPYGPPGGLNTYLTVDEDRAACSECGEEGEVA